MPPGNDDRSTVLPLSEESGRLALHNITFVDNTFTSGNEENGRLPLHDIMFVDNIFTSGNDVDAGSERQRIMPL